MEITFRQLLDFCFYTTVIGKTCSKTKIKALEQCMKSGKNVYQDKPEHLASLSMTSNTLFCLGEHCFRLHENLFLANVPNLFQSFKYSTAQSTLSFPHI